MEFNIDKGLASTRGGNSTFATGISVKYQKDLPFHVYAKEVMESGARALYKEQRQTAKTYLNRRTGQLDTHLGTEPFIISGSNGDLVLMLQYLLKIRFLDLKKTGRGFAKKVYVPIYNRLMYGFMKGRVYKELRYGFTQEVRNRYTERLREMYKQAI